MKKRSQNFIQVSPLYSHFVGLLMMSNFEFKIFMLFMAYSTNHALLQPLIIGSM